MRISVAMATYNGGAYISEQLSSIIQDIDKDDEIVISDDGSDDNTLIIIKNYMKQYKNIKLINGPHQGVFSNFENAILNCTNEIVFLSDQDDIWIKGKKNIICDCFNNKSINVVMHNAIKYCNNQDLDEKLLVYKSGIIKNIIKSGYWGCCMAFRKEYIDLFMPFNIKKGLAHDQLIGLLGEYSKSSLYIDKVLLKHRIHDNNVTSPKNIVRKLFFRYKLLIEFLKVIKHKKDK